MTTLAADTLAWLIESTAALSAATLLVLLLRIPLRALFGARVAYALWALLPLSLLAVSLPPPVRDALLPVSVLSAPYLLVSTVTVGGVQPLAADGDSGALRATWPLLLWIGGAVVVATLFARQQRRFVRRLGRMVRGDDGLLRAQGNSGCPAVVGAWSPRIVLPADFDARYPAQERELVLAHERAHLARGDTRINLLAVALRCAYWFNPLLHWASAKFRDDQELACDAAVLAAHPHSRRAYADAMLKTQLAVLGLPVGCHWQSSRSLKERILMLKRPLPSRVRLLCGATMVGGVALAVSTMLWAVQPDASPPVSAVAPPVPAVSAQQQTVAIAASEPSAGPGRTRTGRGWTPAPKYPPAALANKIDGRVRLHLLIAPDGSVKEVRVVESEPQSVFDAVSIEAAKTWRLDPPLRNGKPVEGWLQVPITFESRKAAASSGNEKG